jgi:hypothetical protein
MHHIFAPLADEERLPRELLLEGQRYRTCAGPIIGFLWPLAFFATLAIVYWISQDALAALLAAIPLLGAFWLYGRRADP